MLNVTSQRTRVLLAIGIAAVAAMLVLACGGATDTSSSGGGTTATGPAKVGATITANGVSCTLVSVKSINGDEFTQPKSGDIFVLVHVKIVNKSGNEFDYSGIDFHGKSGAGNITDAEAVPPSTYTANKYLDDGKLANGGTVEGDLVIEVPKGDHQAELTWSPSIFDNSTDNAWLLGL